MDNTLESVKRLESRLLLSSPSEWPSLYKSLRELFKQAFISNCHLDDASVTNEELETLEELDESEILENLKDLLESLINFKSNCKSEASGELATRCEQLEKMLQKQESEVRVHIRNEHQLKLHIDTMQQKILELEYKLQESQTTIKEMESKGCETMSTKLKKIEERFHNELTKVSIKYKNETENGIKDNERIQKLEEMYEKKEKSYTKLKQDFQRIRIMLDETNKECKALRKEVEKNCVTGISGDDLTKRKEESIDKNVNKSKINKSTTLEKSKRFHRKKNSDETPSQYGKYSAEPIPPPPETRPYSIIKTSLYNSRRHIRSQSDYTRPISSKKIYTKH
jgi:myosin heavy subunit